MAEDSVFLWHALWTGMFITLIYDGLIVLRKVVVHKSFWEALEDLCFWIYCAIYVFMWLYRESNGTLRWYAVAGALLGMFLYKKLFSGLFVRGGVWILKRVLRILEKFLMVATTPIRVLRRKTTQIHTDLQKKRRKILGNCKIKLKSLWKALKIRLCKQ